MCTSRAFVQRVWCLGQPVSKSDVIIVNINVCVECVLSDARNSADVPNKETKVLVVFHLIFQDPHMNTKMLHCRYATNRLTWQTGNWIWCVWATTSDPRSHWWRRDPESRSLLDQWRTDPGVVNLWSSDKMATMFPFEKNFRRDMYNLYIIFIYLYISQDCDRFSTKTAKLQAVPLRTWVEPVLICSGQFFPTIFAGSCAGEAAEVWVCRIEHPTFNIFAQIRSSDVCWSSYSCHWVKMKLIQYIA
jgi:hypothetical protein